jgi:xanthine dehydrogenase YagR molybdenum-binding subunit
MKNRSGNASEIGAAHNRVDGKLKVTGAAKYTAEYPQENLLYGIMVTSTIASGTIKSIDSKEAETAPGVVAVISHLNRPAVPGYDTPSGSGNPMLSGQEFRPLYDNKVYYNGQIVAVVVADTFERAQYAASLVKVQYEKAQHATNLRANTGKAQPVTSGNSKPEYVRGQADAYTSAPVKIEHEYVIPWEIHNAMEPHAAIVVWEGDDKVTVYNKTQFLKQSQQNIAKGFGLQNDNVQVFSKFGGGAFGSASRTWSQEWAALIAAKKTGKPVKVVLGRDDMFTTVGHRPNAIQKVGIGATADGKLIGITHEVVAETSTYEQFRERIVDSTKFLYACPNINTNYKLVGLNLCTPTWTRGPGETSGVYALECAMDELSYALKMDPIELRMKNYADHDPGKNLPWSAKHLDECYKTGAEHFGWSKRNPQPRSMKDGDMLVGMGMSSGIYPAHRSNATAKAKLSSDGSLLIQCATADTGPGTYTVMSQIAADIMQMPIEKITFELGNSSFPAAPGEFGSMTVASVGSAVHDVCVELQQKLSDIATQKHITYKELLNQGNLPTLEVTKEAKPEEEKKYSLYTFGAAFVEVHVHPLTGMTKVTRVVSVIDNGKIINPKTARSQVLGSVVWGIGMALMEEGIIDHRYGRYVNNNFADYHVPVNADVPDTEVIFIDKEDTVLDPIGAKGLGEIPLVGFAAAVANAVYHATGKRVRELPITPDKLL